MRSIIIVLAYIFCGCSLDRIGNTHSASVAFTDSLIMPLVKAGLERSSLPVEEQEIVVSRMQNRIAKYVSSRFSEDDLLSIMKVCASKEFADAMSLRANQCQLTEEQIRYLTNSYEHTPALRRFLSKEFMQGLAAEILEKEMRENANNNSVRL